jgi:glycine cleavage system H protein
VSVASTTCPDDLVYTQDHEWARVADDGGAKSATIGITAFAVGQLGDVTQVELPKAGDTVKQGAVFGSVESVKAVSDLFAPASGRIIEVNTALADSPELVNDAPYGEGWMIRIALEKPDEISALMTPESYRSLLRTHVE